MWDAKHKLLAGAAIVTFGVAAFMFYSWLQAHDAQQKAEATALAQKEAFDKAGEAIKAAAESMKELQQADAVRAAQTKNTVQVIRDTGAQQVTPEQIAIAVAKAIGSQTPIATETIQATLANPNPGKNLSVTPAQQGLLRDKLTECDVCEVQKSAMEQDVMSRDKQLIDAATELGATKEQVASRTKERDDWKRAAKGTFWSRTKSGLEHIVIAGGVTLAVLCGTGHCKR